MEKFQEQLDTLIKVQKIDSEIFHLQEEKTKKPAEKDSLEKSFQQRKQDLKANEDNLKSLQLKRKECEIDWESKEKEIKKFQTQLFQIKTNKEYTSLQKEIEERKADNAVLEDDILILLEKIDKDKAAVVKAREELSIADKNLKEEMDKIDQELKNIEEKISSLEEEKSQLCTNIEKGLLSKYQRIVKAKAGLALVPVDNESCGGCHQVLPPQIVNEARMRDRIITCEFCARLLYWVG